LDVLLLLAYAVLSALMMISAFFIADFVSLYYSAEYTSIDVGKAISYVGGGAESPLRVLFKVKG